MMLPGITEETLRFNRPFTILEDSDGGKVQTRLLSAESSFDWLEGAALDAQEAARAWDRIVRRIQRAEENAKDGTEEAESAASLLQEEALKLKRRLAVKISEAVVDYLQRSITPADFTAVRESFPKFSQLQMHTAFNILFSLTDPTQAAIVYQRLQMEEELARTVAATKSVNTKTSR